MLEIISSSRYQFALLFSPIFVYLLGEAALPAFTTYYPLLFIALLTAPFIVVFHFYEPHSPITMNESLLDHQEKSVLPSKIENTTSSVTVEQSLAQTVTKPVLKQQLFNLTEALSNYEKNLQSNLLNQIEKQQNDSMTVLTNMQDGNRLPMPVQTVLQAIQQPYVRHGLKVYAWPVMSLPQRKTSLLSCEAGIFMSSEHGFAKLNTIESKTSKGNHGGLLFLIFLKTISLVREQFKTLPHVPVIVDIPSAIFDYPKLVQHLFDYLEHKDFPHHRFLWRVQEASMAVHSAVLSRIHELGGHYVVSVSYPRIESSWPYMQMDAALLHKIVTNQAHRQNHQLLNEFASQSSKIIISDVPQQYNWSDLLNVSFDFAYGSSIAPTQIIENLTSTRSLFSHDASLKIA